MTKEDLARAKRDRKKLSPSRRKAIIERDGFVCQYCGCELSYALVAHDIATDRMVSAGHWPTVDHDIPSARGGSDEDENLVACCAPCNSRKAGKTGSEYRSWLNGLQS